MHQVEEYCKRMIFASADGSTLGLHVTVDMIDMGIHFDRVDMQIREIVHRKSLICVDLACVDG